MKKPARFPGGHFFQLVTRDLAFGFCRSRGRGWFGSHAFLTLERVFLALDGTFEVGAALNRDGFVDDVAFDAGGRGEANLEATNLTNHAAVHNDVVCDAFAVHGRAFAYSQKMRTDVAFNFAFDLNVAGRLNVAGDVQVSRKDGCRRLCLGGGGGEVGSAPKAKPPASVLSAEALPWGRRR